MRTALFGAEANGLCSLLEHTPELELVTEAPDVVICYGGDGTLLRAEAKWPGVPKVPIRNSQRGNRCIPHPAPQVIERLINGNLAHVQFAKIAGRLRRNTQEFQPVAVAMNEFNVHMGHINSAVRFTITLDDQPYDEGREVLGDGFVVCTPFGSTAYFNQITRGIFHTGLGIAFKNTPHHTDHVIIAETTEVGVTITRGPAVLAYDNAPTFIPLETGDTIVIRRHTEPATLLTWGPVVHPSDAF